MRCDGNKHLSGNIFFLFNYFFAIIGTKLLIVNLMLRNALLLSFMLIFSWITNFCFSQGIGYSFKSITSDQGLVHNHINCTLRDQYNYMWFGTESGLSRFDGLQFTNFRYSSNKGSGLSSNPISGLFEGPEGQIWIRTHSKMNVYDQKRGTITQNIDSILRIWNLPSGDPEIIRSFGNNEFAVLYKDSSLFLFDTQLKKARLFPAIKGRKIVDVLNFSKESFWLVYDNGLVQLIHNRSWKRIKEFTLPIDIQRVNYRLFIDGEGDLWVHSKDIPIGAFWIKDGSNEIIPIKERLSNVFVGNIVQDEHGLIWLATDHGGINVFDKKTGSIDIIGHEEYNSRSLPYNSITSLYKDPKGIIWVGTYKGGISYYHPNLLLFPIYQNYAGNSKTLPFDDVNRFIQDDHNNLWIGTNGGGLLHYDFENKIYKQYKHNPSNPNSLPSDVVVSLYLDNKNILWVGTYHGGLSRFDGKTFKTYDKGTGPARLPGDSVWEIFEDSRGRFWVGTLSAGLYLFDQEHERFFTFRSRAGIPISSTYVSVLFEDSKKNIWVGTATGIELITPNGQIKHINEREGKLRLSNDLIYDIKEDELGHIWVATQEGINIIQNDTVRYLNMGDGLIDNAILTLVLDNKNNMWASSAKGLSEIVPIKDASQFVIRNFNKEQGLQSNVFNENSALKMRNGQLIFGGPKGYNIIDPNIIWGSKEDLRPVLSNIYLFNRKINVGERLNGQVILNESLIDVKKLKLPFNQNAISLELSSFNYLQQDNRIYQYQLDGLSDEWFDFETGTMKANFTNLDSKLYKFYIRHSVDNESWSEKTLLLTLAIAPPFWKSSWALLLYVLVLISCAYLWQAWLKLRSKTKNQLILVTEQALQARELDELKTRFFTNVSHEFRTPISLILTPSEQLLQKETDVQKKEDLRLINKNASRLLILVNQLLDFRKLEKNQISRMDEYGDLILFNKEQIAPFFQLAEVNSLHIEATYDREHYLGNFDKGKIESILFNLLSNAIKFSMSGGKVTVKVTIEEQINDFDVWRLEIKDEGPGIPEEYQSRIFDRYFQYDVKNGRLNQGTGIGLSIVKDYVEFLNGNISIDSVEGRGTSFVVVIPIEAVSMPIVVATDQMAKKNQILLIEDHLEFLDYLKRNLTDEFLIDGVCSVKEAKDYLSQKEYDLVIADIQLPDESGIDFCTYLKSSDRYRHIPVLMVTAVMDEYIQLQALRAGASDYILKPFNFELLKSKIASVLNQKSSLVKKYQKQIAIELSQPEIESADEKFIREVIIEVERDLSDSTLSVEILAGRMHMTRVGLYKKILAITGYSPTEYIRYIRLKRAMHLIQHSKFSISEIAYEVGFGNPKQFSKYFKSTFGNLPSYYRKML